MELGPEISLENVLMTYKSDFYTHISAVCVYAHEMGADCYSYMPILREYHAKCDETVPLLNEFCIPIK